MKTKTFVMTMVVFGMLLVAASLGFGQAAPSYAQYSPPVAPAWEPLATLPAAAGDGVAFVLRDTLYHAGGWAGGANYQPIDTVYKLDLEPLGNKGDAFTAPNFTPRFGAAVVVVGERAYVLGGYDGYNIRDLVESFDGTTWRTETSLKQTLNFLAAAATQKRIYVAGGSSPITTDYVWSAAVKTDGTLGEWMLEDSLEIPLTTRLAATDNCLYVVGGKDGSGNLQDKVYGSVLDANGHTQGWNHVSTLPQALALHGAVIDQNILYVLGGETAGGYSDQVYAIEINPATCALTGGWQPSTLPGGGKRRLSVAARLGEIYVLGGQTTGGYTSDVDRGTVPTPEPTPTPAPSLNLRKRAQSGPKVNYNETITYILEYGNPWFLPQSDVVITDALPAGVTFLAASREPTQTNPLSWEIENLLTGTHTTPITFSVSVNPPERAWDLTQTWVATNAMSDTGNTAYLPREIAYTIAYTLSGTPARNGILITDTLPPPLKPLTVTGGTAYAVHGQDVVWRVTEAVTDGARGQLEVAVCIGEQVTATRALVNKVTLDDAYDVTNAESIISIAPVATIIQPSPLTTTIILPSCPPFTHPTTALPPLYPDIPILKNQAWISSDVVTRPIASNVVLHFWAVADIYLPLVLRNP